MLESFGEDFSRASSRQKRARILEAITLLERFPRRGFADLPTSVKKSYGDARKLVLPPFDIIYTYDADADTVVVQGIVHQHGAYWSNLGGRISYYQNCNFISIDS